MSAKRLALLLVLCLVLLCYSPGEAQANSAYDAYAFTYLQAGYTYAYAGNLDGAVRTLR